MYAMLTSEISNWFDTALEKASVLSPEIVAYRQNMGSDQLSMTLQCAIEDAMEANGKPRTPLFALMDDFQKFYDACTAPFIMLSMQATGMPAQGYKEWAAEALGQAGRVTLTQTITLPRRPQP